MQCFFFTISNVLHNLYICNHESAFIYETINNCIEMFITDSRTQQPLGPVNVESDYEGMAT